MAILYALKKYMYFMGVQKPESRQESIFFSFLNCVIFGAAIIYWLTSGWYIAFEAQTFPVYVECSFITLTASMLVVWYSMIMWNRSEYNNLITSMDAIVESRRTLSANIDNVYSETDRVIENYMRIYNSFLFSSGPINLALPALITAYDYYTSSHSFRESVRLWYKASYPFDWKSPLGYSICMIVQSLTSLNVVIFFSFHMHLVAGLCLWVSAFERDLRECERVLNLDLDRVLDAKASKRVTFDKTIIDMLQFHLEVKQFSVRFSALINPNMIIYQLYSILSFCNLLLQGIIFLASGNMSEFSRMLLSILGPITFLYFFCYLGDHLTDSFNNIGNDLYEINWYKLPINIQKNWPVVLAFGHKELTLKGFGGASYTCKLFLKIMKATISYLMVLRRFDF